MKVSEWQRVGLNNGKEVSKKGPFDYTCSGRSWPDDNCLPAPEHVAGNENAGG